MIGEFFDLSLYVRIDGDGSFFFCPCARAKMRFMNYSWRDYVEGSQGDQSLCSRGSSPRNCSPWLLFASQVQKGGSITGDFRKRVVLGLPYVGAGYFGDKMAWLYRHARQTDGAFHHHIRYR